MSGQPLQECCGGQGCRFCDRAPATADYKRPMYRLLDTPLGSELEVLKESGVLGRAVAELWRGRSVVSSVTAARLSREMADALLIALLELPADHKRREASVDGGSEPG